MKILNIKDFKVVHVTDNHFYFGVEREKYEICIEPTLSGFLVAVYTIDGWLLAQKVAVNGKIDMEEAMKLIATNGGYLTRGHLEIFDKCVEEANKLYKYVRSKE